ncbi:MAG: 3-phosphoshikimate 1-carboxyvinyltransferase [Acidobacteria bacterium]|nr:MAG: 3-phosphoshikimate 1-carboxyvinyltransferase [Acidobacteriota bacterium]REJ99058.1 MAG: 3-phosphoshikimate 1-carboxyvinyltransferase [Acidobacteriota bacterium]REK16222.1 MAG: 3-phosphoshikimate 1-carboxyvinyltransferase [Acidobacteriota bacterium]REK43903.1 MAG: 3-phosphoshikimate 1-carboxyvinyltransferase [Acidobacteriota bacterium]
MRIRRGEQVRGEISLPGDKSISHRAAMIGAIAEGTTEISNFGPSADCVTTLRCLDRLGVKIKTGVDLVTVRGVGKTGFAAPSSELDCGNSGTTTRLLAGILAGHRFRTRMTGDRSLSSRPMQRIIRPLSKMGARVRSLDGKLPIEIEGATPLKGIAYDLPVASAQIKSCLLFAGLNADDITTVTEPVSTKRGPVSRDHTERMLEAFGADIELKDRKEDGGYKHSISISGASELKGRPVSVPGDISSAAFLIAAAAGLEGSELIIRDVGINPTRRAIVDAVIEMGADLDVAEKEAAGGEPIADIVVRGGLEPLSGPYRIAGSVVANLIDELPVLAVLGTRLAGGLEVRNAEELRLKESDRIDAVVSNLRKMGAEVEEYNDGFGVGNSQLIGARVDSFGDHRIAMAFAIAGLFADGETAISGHECVDVSFPGFFRVLSDIVS